MCGSMRALTAWSSGQDQAATIKRQLARMLPGLFIFLDVDDLDCINKLDPHSRNGCVETSEIEKACLGATDTHVISMFFFFFV